LIAVAAGLIAFVRDKEISPINRASPADSTGVNSGKT